MFIISFIIATWTIWQHIDNCCARKYQYFHVKDKLEKHHSKTKCWNQCHARGQRPEQGAPCTDRSAAQPHQWSGFLWEPKKACFLNVVSVELPLGWNQQQPGRRCRRTLLYRTAPAGLPGRSGRIPQGTPAGRDPAGIRHAAKGCSGSADFTCSRTRITVPASAAGENAPRIAPKIALETTSAVWHDSAGPSPLPANGPRYSQCLRT